MRFETAQVLEIASLSKDTLRHWKRILNPIADVDGRKSRYDLHELVALCIISDAVLGLGVVVSRISPSADWLFDEARKRLESGTPGVVHFTANGRDIWADDVSSDFSAAAVIRVKPILHRIGQAALTDSIVKRQFDLPFDD